MERKVVVTGSFYARERSTLSVKVPGRLARLSADVGTVIRKGDELAQIDRTDYELRVRQAEAVLAQARAVVGLPMEGDNDSVEVEQSGALREARARLDEATKNRDRAQELSKSKIAPQSELDTAEAAYSIAMGQYQDALEEMRGRVAAVAQRRAELNIARKQLTDTAISAPYDGIVHMRMASVGEYVQGGTPILVVAQVDPLRLRLEVPEREAIHVRPGQSVRVTVSGDTNVYSSTIARVSPLLVEASRMLLVEADVPAAPALRPGLFARAEIVVSEHAPALCVPARAVANFVGIEKVFIVKDGKAIERNITVGRRTANFVEVLSGVSAGDTVALDPMKLRSQQPVVEEANAAAR
jgi:RND family efflux transporter MFP subunit